jgi:membrane-associated phospholipid phosphatase
MGRIKISIILICLIITNYGFSQSILKLNSSIAVCNDNKVSISKDISYFFDDGLNIVKAPLNFSSTELYITGAVAAFTGIAFLSDSQVKTTVSNNHTALMNNFTSVGEKYGRSVNTGVLGTGLYLTGLLLDNKDISSTGRMVVESVIYSGLTVGILKFSLSRGRPYENDGPGDFFDYTLKEEDVSFPSGHAATAFAVSTVLARKIDNVYATIGLYSLAGLTAYQRIYDNKHWFSDVVVGAALGYFIGSTIASSEEERESKNNFLSNVNLMPSVNSKGVGLSLSMNF